MTKDQNQWATDHRAPTMSFSSIATSVLRELAYWLTCNVDKLNNL